MSIQSRRLFHCRYCGHKMRLGAHECGSCYQSAQLINYIPLPLLFVLPVLALSLISLLFFLL